jgi:hypothetical protein
LSASVTPISTGRSPQGFHLALERYERRSALTGELRFAVGRDAVKLRADDLRLGLRVVAFEQRGDSGDERLRAVDRDGGP